MLQEKNTAYLEKLEINVKVETNSYRETCEIVFSRDDGLFGLGGSIKLWACGLGKNGEFTAGSTWDLTGEKYPSQTFSDHKEAHRCLTILLSKSGWMKTGRGESWYNDCFERYELSDSNESKIYKLEKEFGQQLFKVLKTYGFTIDRHLVEQGILKNTRFLELRETSTLVSVIYPLDSNTLTKVLSASAEDAAYSAYQKLISLRQEIESLTG